jgi:hypothetical protein
MVVATASITARAVTATALRRVGITGLTFRPRFTRFFGITRLARVSVSAMSISTAPRATITTVTIISTTGVARALIA